MIIGNPYLTSGTRAVIWQILDSVMELDGIPGCNADFAYRSGGTALRVHVSTVMPGLESGFIETIRLPNDQRPMSDDVVQHEVGRLHQRLRDLLNNERIAAAALERNETVRAALQRQGVES